MAVIRAGSMVISSTLRFLATAPKAAEPFLLHELTQLGAQHVAPTRLGATFTGTLETAYRACLWSRVASRIVLHLHTWPASNAEDLYEGVKQIAWGDHLTPESTLAISVTLGKGRLDNSHFAAQRVKDGIVDYFRAHTGMRPSIDLERPDVRVHVVWDISHATVGIDLAGESLHRRGYRRTGVEAPLKENTAAAIVLRSQWADVARAGGALLDPMCGSGTLPIEAAMIATDTAPGLLRTHFGFRRWGGHQAAMWRELLNEAHDRRKAGMAQQHPPIMGWDMDANAIRAAQDNAARAGFQTIIQWTQRDISDVAHGRVTIDDFPTTPPGVIVTNPPYGERLGHPLALHPLYNDLGRAMQMLGDGWHAYVLIPHAQPEDEALGHSLGLRAKHRYVVHNGNLKCALLEIVLGAAARPLRETRADAARKTDDGNAPSPATARGPMVLPDEVTMLVNRLRKNQKHLSKVIKRDNTNAYRLYDADIPEYAAAVDVYGEHVNVQEYAPPKHIDPNLAQMRLRHLLHAINVTLHVPATHLHVKMRAKQKGTQQYQRMADRGHYFTVTEQGHTFWVNLTDYLDTGLFLDHRITRRIIGNLAPEKDVLNLFAYTGTATVYAGAAGARSTTTVDMSRTYLDWAERNLRANRMTGPQHQLVQANCLTWLHDAARDRTRYDVIFVDPPTFSNSKRMEGVWDVQRDHVALLQQCAAILKDDGVIVFSTNFRRFKLDEAALTSDAIGLGVLNITAKTIPEDFKRNPRIHQCFVVGAPATLQSVSARMTF